MILKNFKTAMSPKIAIPQIDRSVAQTVKPESIISPNININKIELHEVQNVDDMAKEVINYFPIKMLQACYKK